MKKWQILYISYCLILSCATLIINATELEQPTYELVETVDTDIDLRKYQSMIQLNVDVQTPSGSRDDFVFMCDYGYQSLKSYFLGYNYEYKVIKQTTPMYIKMNPFSLSDARAVSFMIPKEESKPPSPIYPLYLKSEEEKYLFIRRYNATYDFEKLLKEASKLLVDLAYANLPFNRDYVYFALYEYPTVSGDIDIPSYDEILVERIITSFE